MTRPSGNYLQGLEGYSLDPGFDINTVRDAGNVKEIRDLIEIKCGMRENVNGIKGLSANLPKSGH